MNKLDNIIETLKQKVRDELPDPKSDGEIDDFISRSYDEIAPTSANQLLEILQENWLVLFNRPLEYDVYTIERMISSVIREYVLDELAEFSEDYMAEKFADSFKKVKVD